MDLNIASLFAEREAERYALHTRHVNEQMVRVLKTIGFDVGFKSGRGQWLDAEMEKLADPANYANDLELAWRRIRAPSRNALVLGRLKGLAAWRESEAQQ